MTTMTPEHTRRSLLDKPFFWVPIVPLVALDLWSKSAAFAFVTQHNIASMPEAAYGSERYLRWERTLRHSVFDAGVEFDLVCWRNTGTIWGLFQDWNLPLVIMRCAALALILYFVLRIPRRLRGRLFVLGAIFAGAIGNLYDNLFEPNGGVRDFLSFFYRASDGTYPLRFVNPFPAFNVADSCISVGAITLAFLLWRNGSEAAATSAERDAVDAASGGPATDP